ncbi:MULTISPECIES: GTP cyclohydrolase II [unclassified Methylotenera]|jgi:GTP cyclohydrolase II|uniref:GTP cyclohydrolase II n=1 Tax=unclassified Methylotenera TaxID=2643294 RepID=UPI000380BC70|nr:MULTISPECIES: GTP cyclohydrolase II [unclassified Methylotenera]
MSDIIQLSTSDLPTAFGNYKIHVYQDADTDLEHIALVMGDLEGKQDVLTRVHSECVTGDVFSSTRCDCGDQLKLAQQRIRDEGAGIIIYLRGHEGRAIGLPNKIRAYALQDKGLDTVDANLALGLPIDNRSYDVAANILKLLHIQSIKLMTNNPTKSESLASLGILVNQLIPIQTQLNDSNQGYLATKKNKLGHHLTL